MALALNKSQEKPIVEMVIGGWNNTSSVIRVDMDKSKEVVKVDSKDVVSANHFKNFYISWARRGLTIRLNGPMGPVLMEAQNCVNFPVQFLGVRTAWGATGSWRIKRGVLMSGRGKKVLAYNNVLMPHRATLKNNYLWG